MVSLLDLAALDGIAKFFLNFLPQSVLLPQQVLSNLLLIIFEYIQSLTIQTSSHSCTILNLKVKLKLLDIRKAKLKLSLLHHVAEPHLTLS